MQMRGENRSRAHPPQNAHEILGDVETFARVGAGERFVEQHQAVTGGVGEDVAEPLRFIAKTTGGLCQCLLDRVMGIDTVHRAEARFRGWQPQPQLGQNLAQSHHLHIGRFAALIGAGENRDAAVGIHVDIVFNNDVLNDDVVGICLVDEVQGQIEIVALMEFTDAFMHRGDLGSAQGQSLFPEPLHEPHSGEIKRHLATQTG